MFLGLPEQPRGVPNAHLLLGIVLREKGDSTAMNGSTAKPSAEPA